MKMSNGMFFLCVSALFLVLAFVGLFMGVSDLQTGAGPVVLIGSILLGVVGLVLVLIALWAVRHERVQPAATVELPRSFGYPPDELVRQELHGQTYEVYFQAAKTGKNRRPALLRIGVLFSVPASFHFNKETVFDRFCKQVGIAREHQTGDTTFDEQVYVRAPGDGYIESYLADAAKRAAVLRLMELGFPLVEVADERIVAEWRGFNPTTDHHETLTDDVAEQLLILTNNLPALSTSGADDWAAAAAFFNALLWTFSGLFALTAASLYFCPPVRTHDILFPSLVTFLVAYLGFGWISAFLLRGSSTSHDRWARLMALGVLLIACGAVGSLVGLNAWADRQPTIEHDLVITNKHVTVSRGKNSTSRTHYITVAAWDRPGESIDFMVWQSDYNRITPGVSRLHLTTGPGAFGFEWVKAEHVLP